MIYTKVYNFWCLGTIMCSAIAVNCTGVAATTTYPFALCIGFNSTEQRTFGSIVPSKSSARTQICLLMWLLFDRTNILYHDLATLAGNFDPVGKFPAHIQGGINKPITNRSYFEHNGLVVCAGLAILLTASK